MHVLDRYSLCMRSVDPSSDEGRAQYELALLRREIDQMFKEAQNTCQESNPQSRT